MPAAVHPVLEPGRVYRTKELATWGANAPRLARRLVDEGVLIPLAHGLYACPKRGRFGVVAPSDEAIMKAFLEGGPFVFTGPDRWNALGLGATAVFASALVYNTKRSGRFELGGRTFELRRVAFPQPPTLEWFVVDLFENAGSAGVTPAGLTRALMRALKRGAFDARRLGGMSDRFGRQSTREWIHEAIRSASA
ncbi:hypothetical protein D7X30_24315 [Corallococcus sp. AB011P]|nr:hypothetical protein D7X30_24315 [Corallococcus sp. AB011P]